MEDTALQLSEKKNKQNIKHIHFVYTWKDMKWIIYKFTFGNFKLDSNKDNVNLLLVIWVSDVELNLYDLLQVLKCLYMNQCLHLQNRFR